MSSPSDREQPVVPEDPGHPTTREIPVVAPAEPGVMPTQQLWPPAGSTAVGASAPGGTREPAPQTAVQTSQGDPGASPSEPNATGPVGFVPGLPDAGNQPAQGRHQERTARPRGDRTAVAGLGLALLGVLLLELGLALDVDGRSLWSTVFLWSAFATVAGLLVLPVVAAAHPAGRRLGPGLARRTAFAGLGGLGLFWLLVVLPHGDTDRGFVLTAAVACSGAAVWLAPRSKG